ncbi:hypothetical protein [Nocardioides sp.]|uniref:hypothetical protein n=1 Tax=Nocardioides sp. TaxID=35761 RepID=UPI0026226F03|nr:hypothetical protein [Nocardioides sp.]
MTGAAALVMATATSALAFHGYSNAIEDNHAGHYTGLQMNRVDRAITQGTNGCSTFFSGYPTYQTQWLKVTSTTNWMELGTGHQCGDTMRYWYWGYGFNGVWYPMGEALGVTAGVSHEFRIARAGTDDWHFRVDGALKASLAWAVSGAADIVGLESYGPGTTTATYSSTSLKDTLDGGSWQYWGGKNGSRVDTPEMCGGWNSATSWRASENVAC